MKGEVRIGMRHQTSNGFITHIISVVVLNGMLNVEEERLD